MGKVCRDVLQQGWAGLSRAVQGCASFWPVLGSTQGWAVLDYALPKAVPHPGLCCTQGCASPWALQCALCPWDTHSHPRVQGSALWTFTIPESTDTGPWRHRKPCRNSPPQEGSELMANPAESSRSEHCWPSDPAFSSSCSRTARTHSLHEHEQCTVNPKIFLHALLTFDSQL